MSLGPSSQQQTILVASHDPQLADVRKSVLEAAGFRVISAMDPGTVRTACEKEGVQLVLIGYSMAPADKRRVWKEARSACKTPILELYRDGSPSVVDQHALFSHRSHSPEDFLDSVIRILRTQ